MTNQLGEEVVAAKGCDDEIVVAVQAGEEPGCGGKGCQYSDRKDRRSAAFRRFVDMMFSCFMVGILGDFYPLIVRLV